ncbi:MAG: lysophospholipid acyltransferase family protein [Pseudomonadales bacterium]
MLPVLFARCLAFLPACVLYFFSDILAVVLERFVRYRHKAIKKNLAKAFPEKSKIERKQIEHQFYRYLADVIVEIIMLSRMKPEELLRRFEIVGLDEVKAVMDKKQSVILLSAHQGNWEWMLAAVATASPYALDALYRPLHNPAADKFFMAMRTRFRSHMIPADKAAKIILKLRRETRAFGILGDQNPRRRDNKYWTTFMGVDTPVVIGPERIAKMTNYPLYYVATEKVSRGKYRCHIKPLAQPPYEGDGQISQCYMDAVEAHIRQQPECWMWSHHRWRYEKKDCPEFSVGQ